MNPLFYILELSAIFCFFYFVLGTAITKTWYRIIPAITVNFLWIFYLATHSSFPNTFTIIIIITLIFEEHLYFKFCWVMIYSLVESILCNIIGYIYYLLIGKDFNSPSDAAIYYNLDLTIFIFSIIIFTLAHKIFIKHTRIFHKISLWNHLLIITVVIIDFFLSTVSSILYIKNINTLGRRMVVFAIFIMIFMSIILLLMYFKLLQYNSILQQRDILNQNSLALEQKHYKDLQRKNEDLRAFRHDYNHHIVALQGLTAAKDWSNLENYIENLATVKEQTYFFSTNNTVTDAIVNYFYENIPKDIDFKVNGKFHDKLFVKESDLCTILSNLLKNAVEAATKETNASDKRIHISLSSDIEHIIILVENTSRPYTEKELIHLNTTKSDSVNHGFGLLNIRNSVAKYDGKLDLQYKNGIFSAGAYLRNIN